MQGLIHGATVCLAHLSVVYMPALMLYSLLYTSIVKDFISWRPS